MADVEAAHRTTRGSKVTSRRSLKISSEIASTTSGNANTRRAKRDSQFLCLKRRLLDFDRSDERPCGDCKI